MIHVLIVDDSPFIRKALKRILESDPSIAVVGTASDGREGLKKALELAPDVITLDIRMPEMDGLQVLKELMLRRPTPVLVLSQYTSEGTELTLKALELGAMDFVDKSSKSYMKFYELAEEIITKVKAIAGGRPRGPLKARPAEVKVTERRIDVVAIGASTGGPQALQTLLPSLPEDIPFGILIVQHMPEGFIDSLATRLDRLSRIEVRTARDAERVEPGVALFAPWGVHMKVKKDSRGVRVSLDPEPSNLLHRPSIDVLFESVAEVYGDRCMGVILTGMGSDGAEGLKKIRQRGGITIAQDRESSVIFGMPRAAVEKNAAQSVISIEDMAEEILRRVSSNSA